jgi:hypothetical protein
MKPFDCDICGGKVTMKTGPGRKQEFRTDVFLDVPVDFPIAECEKCHETYMTTKESEQLDDIFNKQISSGKNI